MVHSTDHWDVYAPHRLLIDRAQKRLEAHYCGDRVARYAENGFPADQAEHGGFTRHHCHAMEDKGAELADQGLRKIFSACARARVYDEHVVSGEVGVKDGPEVRLVLRDLRLRHLEAHLLAQRR